MCLKRKNEIVTFLKFARILLGDNTGGGEVSWLGSSVMETGFQLDCFVHSFAVNHMYSQDLRKIRLAPNLREPTYGVRRKCLYTKFWWIEILILGSCYLYLGHLEDLALDETVILKQNLNKYLTFCWPCIVIHPYNKNQQDALFIFNLFQ